MRPPGERCRGCCYTREAAAGPVIAHGTSLARDLVSFTPPANTTIAADAAGTNIGMSADGSVIAFGAPTATAGPALESGEVFVATETSTGTWALTGTDTSPNPVADDDLGGGDQSVAVAGNGSAIVAGAHAANGQTGEAFVFPVS